MLLHEIKHLQHNVMAIAKISQIRIAKNFFYFYIHKQAYVAHYVLSAIVTRLGRPIHHLALAPVTGCVIGLSLETRHSCVTLDPLPDHHLLTYHKRHAGKRLYIKPSNTHLMVKCVDVKNCWYGAFSKMIV